MSAVAEGVSDGVRVSVYKMKKFWRWWWWWPHSSANARVLGSCHSRGCHGGPLSCPGELPRLAPAPGQQVTEVDPLEVAHETQLSKPKAFMGH